MDISISAAHFLVESLSPRGRVLLLSTFFLFVSDMIISNMSDVDVAGKEFVRDVVPLVLGELQRPDWWDRQLFDVESVNPGHTD